MSCGNVPGSNKVAKRQRPPHECYTPDSYRRAIERACDLAFSPTSDELKRGRESKKAWLARLTKEGKYHELRRWQREHRWHPHRLRHTAATEIRREFGLEAARIILGHSSALVTDAVYAERDASKVIEVMRKIG
jgi:integrase